MNQINHGMRMQKLLDCTLLVDKKQGQLANFIKQIQYYVNQQIKTQNQLTEKLKNLQKFEFAVSTKKSMQDLSRLIQMSNTNMSQGLDHARTHKNSSKMIQLKFFKL